MRADDSRRRPDRDLRNGRQRHSDDREAHPAAGDLVPGSQGEMTPASTRRWNFADHRGHYLVECI